MSLFVLACFAYVSMALPDSVLGVAWPAMSVDFDQPVGALGLLLPFGVGAAVLSSAMTGRLLTWMSLGRLLTVSTVLSVAAMAGYAAAPSFWGVAAATVLLGLASGAIDSALNAYAAGRFGPRQITWMHASYGLGSVIGPAVVTLVLSTDVGWRWAYVVLAGTQAALGCAFVANSGRWAADARPADARPRGATPRASTALVLGSGVFVLQTGVEGGIGLWGYLYLTAGQGLPADVAGLVVSGYWGVMFLGRLALGPLAERVGVGPMLAGSVAGIVAGTGAMAAPGPVARAVGGLLLVALASAPVFPLLILTTADRVGGEQADRAIGVQLAAANASNLLLPGVVGLLVERSGAAVIGPALLAFALAMAAAYALLARLGRRAGGPVASPA
ncbi:MFS transporter [Streptomyces hainanensis]|uniref:MFS transporter n=1 Tax=Streptomyces hainanensis TaxID=402648 RepID=A0A4R4T1S4_9ACTN|nr:MFS transporter [Streptomyces hainanensis]TDC70748.1 MFS transporter [Streptomyces hainanensis]